VRGFGLHDTCESFHLLMTALGYAGGDGGGYVAQGGDWGALVILTAGGAAI
jgi:hypothetical protein